MFNFSGGVTQPENGLGTANMFAPKDPSTQGQYNPIELLQMLMKKKPKNIPSQGQSMTPFQQPIGQNYPNFNQGMMPQGAISPNGQIMPNFNQGAVGLLG